MSEEKQSLALRITSAFLVTAIVGAVFYGVTFGIFYFTADDVECGNIAGVIPYCSGTYESSTVDQDLQVNRTVEKSCYQNGEKINCSELEDYEFYQENSYRSNWPGEAGGEK